MVHYLKIIPSSLACIKMLSKPSWRQFCTMMLSGNDLSDFECKLIIGEWTAGASFMKYANVSMFQQWLKCYLFRSVGKTSISKARHCVLKAHILGCWGYQGRTLPDCQQVWYHSRVAVHKPIITKTTAHFSSVALVCKELHQVLDKWTQCDLGKF